MSNFAEKIKGLEDVYRDIETILDLRNNEAFLRNRELAVSGRDNSYAFLAIVLEEQAQELLRIAKELRS